MLRYITRFVYTCVVILYNVITGKSYLVPALRAARPNYALRAFLPLCQATGCRAKPGIGRRGAPSVGFRTERWNREQK
ncbi:MAG: hypothetical protein GY862_12065 [Gammaproteobacteria bacterium]|nr:hypothetical protein [Gammaproteobacteria bacterium]